MSTLVARSDVARDVLSLYGLITWISIGIGVLVFAILGYVLIRFRDRPGAPLPPQTHGRPWLEIAWTIGPAIILLVIAVPTLQVIFRTQSQAKPRDALEIVVRGYQWWWEFAYPALGVVTANELHLPAGRRVVFTLQGPDVIHSFWVPKLGGKRDVSTGPRQRDRGDARHAGRILGAMRRVLRHLAREHGHARRRRQRRGLRSVGRGATRARRGAER